MILACKCYNWLYQQQQYINGELTQYFVPLSITLLLIIPIITNAFFKHVRLSVKQLANCKMMPIAMVAYLIVNTALLMASIHYLDTTNIDLVDPTLLIVALFLGYTLGAKRIYKDSFTRNSIIPVTIGLTLLYISAALPEVTLWESVSLNYLLPLNLPLLLLGVFLLAGFNNTVLSYGYQGMNTHTRNVSNYIANIVLAISILAACYLA